MSKWADDLLLALHERDAREKAFQELYHAYTQLADRSTFELRSFQDAAYGSVSRAAVDALRSDAKETIETPTQNAQKSSRKPLNTPDVSPINSSDSAAVCLDTPSPLLARLRSELSAAQLSKSVLGSENSVLKRENATLKDQLHESRALLTSVTDDRNLLNTKLDNLKDEMTGKNKLIADLETEIVVLELELQKIDERINDVKRDNEVLVARWMAKMALEANNMNRDHGFN